MQKYPQFEKTGKTKVLKLRKTLTYSCATQMLLKTSRLKIFRKYYVLYL